MSGEESVDTLWQQAGDAGRAVCAKALDALEARGVDLRPWLLAVAASASGAASGSASGAGAGAGAAAALGAGVTVAARLEAADRLGRLSGDEVDEALFRLACAEEPAVQEAARSALRGRPPERLAALGEAAIGDSSAEVRRAGAWALGAAGRAASAARLAAALGDADVSVRIAALDALARCDVTAGTAQALRLLEDGEWTVRQEAANVLERAPSAGHVPALARQLADDDEDVRRAIHAALAAHDDDAAGVALLLGALDDDEDVSGPAGALLRAEPPAPAVARLRAAGLDPAQAASESGGPSLVAIGAFLSDGAARRGLAVELLDLLRASKDWEHRQRCAQILGAIEGPEPGERLVALCKDADEDVRVAALRALAARPDPAAWQEVVIALADPHATVREAAEGIVAHAESFPGLAGLLEREGEAAWKRHRTALDEVLAWGRAVGHEFLGEPVEVVALRGGAGQTRYGARGGRVPVVEVNPEPLFEPGPHGVDVVKGVILHELGHHAYDFRQPGFKSANGAAYAEGVGPIFDFLLDERLERRLRAHDADWGELIDRANAQLREAPPVTVPLAALAAALRAPPADVERRVRAGELPGEMRAEADGPAVEIPGWSILTLPGVVPPLHAFFFALLVVRTTRLILDDAVRAALALVPPNLKDLDHAALVRLSVAIGDLLGVRDNGKAAHRAWRAALRRHRQLLGALERARCRAAAGRALRGWLEGAEQPPPKGPKQRKVVYARQQRPPLDSGGPPTRLYNLSAELGFPELAEEQTLVHDPVRHAAIAGPLRPHVRRLREHFERLGRRAREEHAQRRGQRLDLAQVRDFVLTGRPDVLVHGREDVAPDAYIGLLIDRSGSMAGAEMELAQRFGVLLAEAARGLRGLTGHVNAFDDDTFWRLGDFERNAIATLTTGGANNDCGALVRAADLALRSRRRHRLLVMISDGSPTECSVSALRRLVQALRVRHGLVCAQVAVAELKDDAFPNFLDVTACDTQEAVARFGRLLERLTAAWH
ncbi:MAG TPA: HEAT repeat domain-containing protein [Myxococcota bacterium]|nr:HEAT repeat domain-containing protein [Myxococcota bacterium]